MGERYVIAAESPDTVAARELIGELEDALGALYPAESRHGYSVDKLIREGVHFFVLRVGEAPAACGGIQFYPGFAELKRMYVRPDWRGRGLGRAVLEHLEAHARSEGCRLVRLETGVHQAEGIRLYERSGFAGIGAFPPYRPDRLSLFYEKDLGE
ncbi:MAG: GNAT family N-acetyltransferase [Dehalococcoidia bacterium]